MKKVIVLGSINMDLVTSTNRFPLKGETVIGESFFTNPGGKGANQAVASAKQGAKTLLLGAVGDDVYGKHSIENISSYGVNCDLVKVKNASTGTAIIILHNTDNRIIVNSGANALYTFEEAKQDLLRNSKKGDILVLQLEMDFDVTMKIIPFAKELGLSVIFNPAPMSKDLDIKVLRDVDLLIVNEIEARMLTSSEKDETELIHLLKKFGAKDVIITLGAEGGIYTYRDTVQHYPAYKTEAKDTTGAGDAFVGSVAASLIDGLSLTDAIKRASYVAGVAVTRFGAQQAIPTKEEIDELIKK
ncbi:MAG: Ribokinase [Tenericutes bacterium ADurb.Bin239]|nr:MAG: Ribokinase [Tenericutes bacterium ADurb.Bin239]